MDLEFEGSRLVAFANLVIIKKATKLQNLLEKITVVSNSAF